MASTVFRYTLTEFLDLAEATPVNPRHVPEDNLGDFRGWTLPTREAIQRSRHGDPGMVAAIEQEIDRLEIGMQTDRVFKSTPGFVGCVNVGAYLGGSPTCMRSRQRAEALVRHVNVYINSGFSGGINLNAAAKRGAAIVGLLDQIQKAGLGLTIHVISEYDHDRVRRDCDLYHLVSFEQPLDLSVIGFALTHPAFERSIGMKIAYSQGSHTSWPSSFKYGDEPGHAGYVKHLAEALDMGPRDIYIPPMYLDDPMVRDPENWIKNTLLQIET